MTKKNSLIELVPIKSIRYDEKYYPRKDKESNHDTVLHYRSAKKAGSIFPPIILNKVRDEYILIDGLHRLHAFSPIDEHIRATIYQNLSDKQMLILAIESNAIHGRPLDYSDIIHCGEKLEKMGLSIEQISSVVKVSTSFFHSELNGRNTVRNTRTNQKVGIGSSNSMVPFYDYAGYVTCEKCNGLGRVPKEKMVKKV